MPKRYQMIQFYRSIGSIKPLIAKVQPNSFFRSTFFSLPFCKWSLCECSQVPCCKPYTKHEIKYIMPNSKNFTMKKKIDVEKYLVPRVSVVSLFFRHFCGFFIIWLLYNKIRCIKLDGVLVSPPKASTPCSLGNCKKFRIFAFNIVNSPKTKYFGMFTLR